MPDKNMRAVIWLVKTNKRILMTPAVPLGKERWLISQTAGGNRAYRKYLIRSQRHSVRMVSTLCGPVLQSGYIMANWLTGIPGLVVELIPGNQRWSYITEHLLTEHWSYRCTSLIWSGFSCFCIHSMMIS